MPIGSATSIPLPASAYSRETRARLPAELPAEIEDQAPESISAPAPTYILPSDNNERVNESEAADEQVLRALPSFDELPVSQRNALQSYLETQFNNGVQPAGGELVGVDTFA